MGNIRAGQMGDYLARKEALRTWTSEQLEAQSDWLLSGFDVTREEAPKRKIIEE